MVPGVLWLAVIAVLVLVVWRAGRGSSSRWRRVGPGTSGTIYDLLNEDKRKAIEIIVEERAEARDPEDAEGDLPRLGGGAASSQLARDTGAPPRK